MQVINSSVEILTPITNDLLKMIEIAGRTCYKSEDRITEDSTEGFVSRMIASNHGAMLEHAHVSLRVTCDRGVTHEIVRHRLASYAQESTRYCNYAKDKFGGQVTYIDPVPGFTIENKAYSVEQLEAIMAEWITACEDAERHYLRLIELGCSPQMARGVLNNATKTEIVITMNMREWRHFIGLRASTAAHPQIREIAQEVLRIFREKLPVIVADITH